MFTESNVNCLYLVLYSIYPEDDSPRSKHVALINTKNLISLQFLFYAFINFC